MGWGGWGVGGGLLRTRRGTYTYTLLVHCCGPGVRAGCKATIQGIIMKATDGLSIVKGEVGIYGNIADGAA